MNDTAVSIENLSVAISGNIVLEDVNLIIRKNELVSILGPNGSGKTTLLRAVLGFCPIKSGKINIFGRDVGSDKNLIGYVPQYMERKSDFPLSVKEVILYGMYSGCFRNFSENDNEKADRFIEKFSLAELKKRRFAELSGGEAQRVLLARALVGDPKILLLDEPTASADRKSQDDFFALLEELQKKMAVVLVTHDLGAVSTHIKRIVCLNKTVNYDGPTEEGLSKLDETYRGKINIISHSHHGKG
ncbi:MAG: ABC transporter ATP-binding protein [bacterium]|nr:ABC transporter ATP-binding protein [bacterium]